MEDTDTISYLEDIIGQRGESEIVLITHDPPSEEDEQALRLFESHRGDLEKAGLRLIVRPVKPEQQKTRLAPIDLPLLNDGEWWPTFSQVERWLNLRR